MRTTGGHETKYVIDNSASHIIMAWLKSRCWEDSYYAAGSVSSIYYDTPDWHFLREKINSDFLKQKIRVRWYSDIETEYPYDGSFLEAKFKTGSRRRKTRIRSDISGQWLARAPFHDQKWFQIIQPLREKGVPFPGPLFPAFQITYKRWRFIEPLSGARINLDCDIHMPRVNCQMVPLSNPFFLRKAVFEFKGDSQVLPQVLFQLTAMGCRNESFSKYMVCYKKIMRI